MSHINKDENKLLPLCELNARLRNHFFLSIYLVIASLFPYTVPYAGRIHVNCLYTFIEIDVWSLQLSIFLQFQMCL